MKKGALLRRRAPFLPFCSSLQGFLPGFEEHGAEDHGQKAAADQNGSAPPLFRAPDAQEGAQNEKEDDGVVLEPPAAGGGIAVLHRVEQQLSAAAEISGAHGGGAGVAADLAEGLHLHGAHKGDQYVGRRVPLAGGE